MIGKGEIIVIILVLLVIFGASRFPGIMKSFAEGINEFKKGIKGGGKKTSAPPAKKSAPKKPKK